MAYAPTSDTPNAGEDRFGGSRRITVTLGYSTHKALVELSSAEGRSVSNLVSHLLEWALTQRAKREAPSRHHAEQPTANRQWGQRSAAASRHAARRQLAHR
jgi:hypothetical protein